MISKQKEEISELENALEISKNEVETIRHSAEELREAYDKESKNSALEIAQLKRKLAIKNPPPVTEIEEIIEDNNDMNEKKKEIFKLENLMNSSSIIIIINTFSIKKLIIAENDMNYMEEIKFSEKEISEDGESQILHYARRQSLREEEFNHMIKVIVKLIQLLKMVIL